jgi:hypothetical protein
MQILPEQFESILPLAVKWAEAKEKVILEHGTALSPQYIEDARSVGVRYAGFRGSRLGILCGNSQSAEIVVNGQKVGMVEIFYLETDSNSNASPFLEEERRMLYAFSERWSKISWLKRLPERERGALPHRDFALEEQCRSSVR